MTLEHMIYHAQCVERAVEKALIVVDMPFGTYQGNSRLALESAIKIMKETNGHAVKLEGGSKSLKVSREFDRRHPGDGTRTDASVDIQIWNLQRSSQRRRRSKKTH